MSTPSDSSAVAALERVDLVPPSSPQLVGLGILLLVLVAVAGTPSIDAPWMPGDEFIFIVRNPDVNPGADALEPPGNLGARLWRLTTTVHEDLYQPIPMIAYAIEWELSGGSPAVSRATDVALHGINSLLVWAALGTLLTGVGGVAWTRSSAAIAWGGAVIWALHPALSNAYAADMGRTHLLSALFSLLALIAMVRAVGDPRGRVASTLLVLLLLSLAMLCKPVAGWILPAAILYASRRGFSATLRSPLIWLIGLQCVGFSLLTIQTSADAGLLDDVSKGLFGDPITRSAYGTWLYVRNAFAPVNLLYWYAPHPETGWGFWPVWAGLAIFAASVAWAALAWRASPQHYVTLAWTWGWGHILPVIGLVAAREVAAYDRYLYQPLAGLLAIPVIALARRMHALGQDQNSRRIVVASLAIGVVLIFLTLPGVRVYRSPLLRAERLVERDAGDPRAYEALAAAYNFAQNRPLPRDDMARIPAGVTQKSYFAELTVQTLIEAVSQPRLEYFFPGVDDRAPFHRRLSYRLLVSGRPDLALQQAELARDLQPGSYNTWRRMAQACRALGRTTEALDAYQRAEQLLPDDALTQRVHFAEFGDLLISQPGRDREACPKFAAALALAPPRKLAEPAVWREAAVIAMLGAARCHIRFGQGADGFAIAREVLQADPMRTQAWLVAGEYHLRSQHFDQAIAAYGEVVRNHTTHYEALRGYHEALFQADRLSEAVDAWRAALAAAPDDVRFAGFLVWTSALADDPRGAAVGAELLAREPDNAFACLAASVRDWRAGAFTSVIDWVERAGVSGAGTEAREFERTAAGVRVLRERGKLGDDSAVLESAIYAWGPFGGAARAQAAALLDVSNLDGRATGLSEAASRVARRLSDVGAETP